MSIETLAPDTTTAAEQLHAALKSRIEACKLELPLLPQVALKILTMTADEHSDAAAIASLIHSDQALASHVLRIANSAYFAGTSPIVSLRQAVARLGFDALVAITVAASARNRVYAVPGFEAEAQMLWRHAFASGLWGKEIARMLRRNVETAFLCGLLHNIGKPVVLRSAVEIQKKLRLRVDREQVLGYMEELHGQAGALLAVKWSLPRVVVESVVFCATGRGDPQSLDDARIARYGDHLAHHLLDPEAVDETTVRAHEMVPLLNLYPDDVAQLLARREAIVKLVAEVAL